MKKLFPNRAMVLIFAIVLIGGGIAWTTYQQRTQEEESGGPAGVPVTGYVSSIRRDAIGCKSSIPFAAKDCRFVAKIHFGQDQTYYAMKNYYFLPPPSIAAGDPVTGVCTPTGRCTFDQLKDRPYGLVISLLSLFGAMLVGGWIYRYYRRPR